MNSSEPNIPPSAAAAPPLPPAPVCANCGASAPGEYCAGCGQETRELPTAAEFLRESVEHFLSLDSKALRTLARLLFTPGGLTLEYLAGRRARYMRPLRLYLWISILTIAATETFGLHLGLRLSSHGGIYLLDSARRAPAERRNTRADELRPMEFILDHFDTPGLRRFKAMSTEEQSRFMSRQRHRYLQYFLLLLVPVFALILELCYRNRRRPYAEHLVFYLHAQSFLLVMLLMEAKLPGVVALVMSLWVIAYFVLALKRVYGGGWVDTFVRGTTTVGLTITTFLVTGALLAYALLELQ